MIDIHTHITPDVDDGSYDMEMSMEMLRRVAEQGGTKVFLTPHSDAFEWGGPENVEYVYAQMRQVHNEVIKKEIPVQIYQGCEIYTSRAYMDGILQDLQSGRIPSMNQTQYIMAEFSTSHGDMNDALFCLRRYIEEGWIPIIAHAERYNRTFSTIENIRFLKKVGCLVQVNLYDLDEEPIDAIRECARELLKEELVDMVGSDTHRMDHRPPALKRGAQYIWEHCREGYAERILWKNAEMLLCMKG